ncbi:MAG: hypothetical protein AB1634_11895 [Thermodesulfobacteriota bacterium]
MDEYRAHFERVYCRAPIVTFDGIPVRFRKSDFDHCMQKTARGGSGEKIGWATDRLERIDWIKATLEHAHAELYFGWDNKRRVTARSRRVAVVFGRYVVVVAILWRSQDMEGRFITAYPADESGIARIRTMPQWRR